jgi:hypothetical protein
LLLVTRAEESTKEDEDQRITVEESEMLVEETRFREV